jgi:proline racemase
LGNFPPDAEFCLQNAMKIIWTVDSHTAGEGTRLVTQGLPLLRGKTMAEKLAYAEQHLAWAPGALLLEPRGHKDLYGAILTDPCSAEADIGVVFMDNQGFEPMCGHGMIGVAASVLETGLVSADGPETSLVVDTAAGLVGVRVCQQDGQGCRVAFENVPSFAYQLDVPLLLPGGQQLKVDVAFGGNFFLLVEAEQAGIALEPANLGQLIELGMSALAAANEQIRMIHPGMPHIKRILDVRFLSAPRHPGSDSRSVVILGDRMVDRSPCGTGTSAELAVRFARGQLQIGEPFVTESILGTRFTGKVVREAKGLPYSLAYPAVIPLIEGQAFLTGMHQFVFEPGDPFKDGFMLDGKTRGI